MNERVWEGLLSTVVDILEDLGAQGLRAPEIVMGGGTVLMMRMHQRYRSFSARRPMAREADAETE
jgi:hypothetical protein